MRSSVVQGWTESVLSCARTSIWQMFPKGWIARPFQTHSQTTLIAVCFVSPARLSGPHVKHLRSIFKTKPKKKKSRSHRRMHVQLSDTRGTVHCSQAFIPLSPLPQPNHLISGSQKKCSGPAGLARLNPAADLFGGVFPSLRWVLRGDRISSAPKCFLFLPLFIFLPSLGGTLPLYQGPHTCSVSRPAGPNNNDAPAFQPQITQISPAGQRRTRFHLITCLFLIFHHYVPEGKASKFMRRSSVHVKRVITQVCGS